ncbi:hypothetical protein LOK49_LG06G01398 [Camellia lanceoleosa]|uniref:Uncharacterized protein n=1 Tax=Camellia lanceoleosa TaxID=1840588 RepID=A0ACC0H9W9_9ERIC|nr:hypothetical protein LOK49_LG06G01398 [Camellia lanceoleosa]
MVELRHSSSMSGRSVSSPRKRDDVASPLVPENLPDDGHDRHSRDRFRSFFSTFQSMFPFFGVDDTRFHPHTSKISLCLLFLVLLAGLISLFSILNGLGPQQQLKYMTFLTDSSNCFAFFSPLTFLETTAEDDDDGDSSRPESRTSGCSCRASTLWCSSTYRIRDLSVPPLLQHSPPLSKLCLWNSCLLSEI